MSWNGDNDLCNQHRDLIPTTINFLHPGMTGKGGTMRQKIIDRAKLLDHDWIILDELKDDDNPDPEVYFETIRKIKEVEENYTEEEIRDMNLLFDIW